MHVEIEDMENFQDMENLLDMEAKHDTLYCTIIGRRKKLYHRPYNLYAYALH